MTIFVWVMFILMIVTAITRIERLMRSYFEPRTAKGEALELFFGIIFISWAAVLLFGGKS